MLKKVALIAVLLPLTLVAHANTPSKQEQDSFAKCSLLSYLSYQAMTNYQNGLSQSQNKAKLYQKFEPTFDQTFGQGSSDELISHTLQVVYEQPKGKTNQEKERFSKLLALGALEGCADEVGLDLNKFK